MPFPFRSAAVVVTALAILGSLVGVAPLPFKFAAVVIAVLANTNCYCFRLLSALVHPSRLLSLDD